MTNKDKRVPDSFGNIVGSVIDNHMNKANISVSQLSALTGINRTVIHDLVSGRSKNPSFFNILLIAKNLNTGIDDFFNDINSDSTEVFNSIDED